MLIHIPQSPPPQADADILPVSIKRPTASFILQGTTGLVGICAGLIYYGPGLTCAQSDICGQWLSHLITEKGAHAVFFAAGALDFGGINAFFAADSIPRSLQYLSKQKTVKAKVIKGSVLAVLTLTQTVQMGLACLGTGAGLLPSVLAILGTVPGALYGVSGMMDIEFPYLAGKIQIRSKELYYASLSTFRELSPTEIQARSYISYYKKQRAELLDQARANWKAIIVASRRLQPDDFNKTPLAYLFQINAPRITQSNAEKIAHHLGQVLSGLIVTVFSLPFGLNGLHTLENSISNEFACWALMLFLGAAIMYGNVKITFHFIDSLLELIISKMKGETFASLPFQLRPKTTLAVGVVCFTIAAPSYALANLLTTNDYHGPEVEGFRYSAMVGVCLYHFNGLLHLYHLFLRRFSGDAKEKFLFQVEQTLGNLEKSVLMDYIQDVENPLSELQKTLHLPVFNTECDMEKQEDINEKSKTSSWIGSWCSFNRPKKANNAHNISQQEALLSPRIG